MKKLIKFIMIFMAGVAFSGCFDNTPACDDEDVQELVKDIFKDSLQQNISTVAAAPLMPEGIQRQFEILKQDINNLDIKLDGFMPQSTNKEIKQITCKVNATIKFPPRDPSEIMSGFAGLFDFASIRKGGQRTFLYTAQTTTDSRIYVEILDLYD